MERLPVRLAASGALVVLLALMLACGGGGGPDPSAPIVAPTPVAPPPIPPIELTPVVQGWALQFGEWKAKDATTLTNTVKPTKQKLESYEPGGFGLRIAVYDKDGVKSGTGGRLTFSDLEPGETGTIKLEIRPPLTLATVGRIVLSN